jgi:hypothetical protein
VIDYLLRQESKQQRKNVEIGEAEGPQVWPLSGGTETNRRLVRPNGRDLSGQMVENCPVRFNECSILSDTHCTTPSLHPLIFVKLRI